MREEEFELLCNAIATLPPRRQKVLILRVFFEYSTSQISATLNMPLQAIHHDLARALESVHAARVAGDVGRDSLFTRLMARCRRSRRDA